MKTIHFDNMKNWIWIVIFILSGLFMLSGGFKLFENPIINKGITLIGFFLQAIYFSRMFWYKNYVQWNKKGVNIRVNSFWGKSLTFDQVKTT